MRSLSALLLGATLLVGCADLAEPSPDARVRTSFEQALPSLRAVRSTIAAATPALHAAVEASAKTGSDEVRQITRTFYSAEAKEQLLRHAAVVMSINPDELQDPRIKQHVVKMQADIHAMGGYDSFKASFLAHHR